MQRASLRAQPPSLPPPSRVLAPDPEGVAFPNSPKPCGLLSTALLSRTLCLQIPTLDGKWKPHKTPGQVEPGEATPRPDKLEAQEKSAVRGRAV